MAHHQDIGGKSPGSTPPDAGEIFAEGLRIPLLKLYAAGQAERDVLRAAAGERPAAGDVRGRPGRPARGLQHRRPAAARDGRRAWPPRRCEAAIDQLLDYAERLTRLEIEKIPDGEYSFTDYLDDDGMGSPPIEIARR